MYWLTTKNHRMFVVLIAGLLFTFCNVPESGGQEPERCRIILYEHPDYQGDSWEWPGFPIENIGDAGLWRHDITSSVKVFGGAKVVLAEGTSYGGRRLSLTMNQPNLGVPNFNDITSSLFVYCPDSSVDTTQLDFGNLYRSDRDGARNYNAGQTRTVKLRNTQTQSGTTLSWRIDNKPDYATIDKIQVQ